jgi:environmental stress-induced protein Ves
MRNRKLLVLIAALLIPIVAFGQGTYQRSRRNAPAKVTPSGAYKGLAGTFHGTLKDLNGKEIVIESDEHQLVSIRRDRKTKFFKDDREIKASDIAQNTLVSIDASEDVDLKPTAITVRVDSPKKASEK